MLVAALALLALLAIAVERLQPGRRWPRVPGWLARALLLNALQIAVVLVAGQAWDGWMLQRRPAWGHALGTVSGALVGYLAITFVYYWWHRARHASDFLWRWLHQVHHSPQRLEILASFYKHPFEIVVNGLLSSAILYLGVGIGVEAATLAVALTGVAELFYHWNVATPHWVGFVFQRPESHCVHHEEGRHASNYADLPLWDMLFGTFHNPRVWNARCGFGPGREERLAAMLVGRDVANEAPAEGTTATATIHDPAGQHAWVRLRRIAIAALLVLGLLRMAADLAGLERLAGAALATSAAPAPKVFSAVQGLETFSSRFVLAYRDTSGTVREISLTPDRYAALRGPYNRRNTFGAVFAYGPVLAADPATRPLFDAVARHAVCGDAVLLRELGLAPETVEGDLRLRVEPREGTRVDLPLDLEVPCS